MIIDCKKVYRPLCQDRVTAVIELELSGYEIVQLREEDYANANPIANSLARCICEEISSTIKRQRPEEGISKEQRK